MDQPTDKLHSVLTIQQIKAESADFKTIVFKDDHSLEYRPGQYLTLVHAHDEGGSEIRRSYSIVSSPFLNEPLAIGVKRIDNGIFSRMLVDRSKPGDRFLCAGVGGFFTLPPNLDEIQTLFFFAAGSGITPILSLIKSALHSHPKISVILVYSNHSKETTAYYEILLGLKTRFPSRCTLRFLFSRTSDLRTARLNRDLLLDIIAEQQADPVNSRFFVCGPEAYMRMVVYTLQEQGFPRSVIKKEDFIPTRPTYTRLKPPDTGPHEIMLQFKGSSFQFRVEYPDTILQAAKKAAVILPYSCETGKCGNCVAVCTKGKVWMSDNEILMDDELKKGMVLTCVGYPVDGDVSLIIE